MTLGDFEHDKGQEQVCDEMFRAADGYYLPKGGRCVGIACVANTYDWRFRSKWVCACTKANGCFFKINNTPIANTDFGADFNPVTDCKYTLGGADDIGNNKKRYRWADGRRSAAQPESEVSGGDEYELMGVCYNPRAHNYREMVGYTGATQDEFNQLNQDLGLPFDSYDDRKRTWKATFTYGRVIERNDGQLVCQFSNPKFPDWSEEHENYLELSVKRGAVRWLSSEYWLKWSNRPSHTSKCFDTNQLISQGAHAGDYDRYLCRIQDDRDQKWYIGVVTEYTSTENKMPVCTAIAADGTYLSSYAHNFWTDKEQDSDRLKTEYFVLAAEDDGSYWGQWSEWSECSNFCGRNLKRTMTRTCHKQNGDEINHGRNCLPDAETRVNGGLTFHYDEKIDDCLDEQVLSETCPRWSNWGDFSACSVTCGTGSKSRTVS